MRPERKEGERLAAVDALRRTLAILTGPGPRREERAVVEIRRSLARYDASRRIAAKRRAQGPRPHGQLRRAAWIISALRERAVDVEAIAKHYGVDVRTAFRDIAFLRSRGAPISYDRGRREYRLDRPWRLESLESLGEIKGSRPRRGSR